MNDKPKQTIAQNLGISIEEIQGMDDKETTRFIEEKIGKKLQWGKPRGNTPGEPLLNNGRVTTMTEVDKKINEIVKNAGYGNNKRK